MDTNKLQEIIVKHKMYVNGEQGGVRANLCGVDLRGVNLNCVDLTYADLCGVNLSDADLIEADLTGANLSGANLIDANLMDANLRGANLSRANLYRADLRRAIGIVSFGPIGKNRRIGYAVKHDAAVMIQLGCFWGTVKEARVAIQNKYGMDSAYEIAVVAIAETLE